jgi:hypothetical protein
MKTLSRSRWTSARTAAWKVVFLSIAVVTVATSGHAQGQVASGIVGGAGSGPYSYNLSFSDAVNATAPIGSVWYAWIPGGFFLPSGPTSASTPAGWTANISGHSIQFVANSAANDIAPGQTLSGFTYQATFSPSQLAAAPNSGESVAYSGGLFSDTGFTFTVLAAPVPEPSPAMLLLAGAAGLLFLGRGNLKFDVFRQR